MIGTSAGPMPAAASLAATSTCAVRSVDPPVSWRVWAYVTGPEFPDIAGAFVDVLVEGPWQQRAFAPTGQ